MHFEMLSAICFNLDQPKILLSGNGLNLLLSAYLAKMSPLAHDKSKLINTESF